ETCLPAFEDPGGAQGGTDQPRLLRWPRQREFLIGKTLRLAYLAEGGEGSGGVGAPREIPEGRHAKRSEPTAPCQEVLDAFASPTLGDAQAPPRDRIRLGEKAVRLEPFRGNLRHRRLGGRDLTAFDQCFRQRRE